MEKLDTGLQRRVWQRVQNKEELAPILPQEDNLKALVLTAQENAMAYRQITGQIGQKHREKVTRLFRESRQCIACMRGICQLRGQQVKVPQLSVSREPVRRSLEKCYHRERRLCSAWEQRVSDPEHGVVFRQLSEQARGRCMTIMEILGEMEEK